MFDITDAQRSLVVEALRRRLPHVTAMAFGSRVGGWPFGRGAKPYSDLDIALWGLESADALALAHLRADFEECALPWRVDVTDAADFPVALRQLVEQQGALLQGEVPRSSSSPAAA